jgi:23S rRNA (adenine2503-C2)-methyltransferase
VTSARLTNRRTPVKKILAMDECRKKSLRDLSDSELAGLSLRYGVAPYRMAQLRHWLYRKWTADFSEMRNLPLSLLSRLRDEYLLFTLQVEQTQTADDGTVKWLSSLPDGNTIETVLIRASQRTTVCVSTQVGCQVRCVFCASGNRGLIRNLTKAEIIDQVLLPCRHLQAKITNIVVMGMGEPLHNLDNLSQALETLTAPDKFALGARHVTISTSGIVPGIRRLAELRRPWNLAVSLHATSDQQRAQLIPPGCRYPIAEILAACQYHRQLTSRMPTLEYALLKDVNDTSEDAGRLAAIATSLHAKINLIPCNPGPSRYQAPSIAKCRQFLEQLIKTGAQATLRTRKGDTIKAACGQLRQRSRTNV